MKVVRPEVDHLVQANLAPVDAGEQLHGDGDLEGARHRKAIRAMEREVPAGLNVDGGYAYNTIGNAGQTGDFILEMVVRSEKRERGDQERDKKIGTFH